MKNMTGRENKTPRECLPAVASCAIFLMLAAMYATYVYKQNANIFFEAQFLHYEFLKELLDRHVTPRGFFTVYDEHMFPGYNLILAANVIFFRIWGGFDSVVHGIFLIVSAAVVVQRIYADANWTPLVRIVAISIISLLLLSATNNPMWGMALSAAGGVCLFVVCARIVERALWGGKILSLWFIVLFPITQIIFLGGYSIGAIAALGVMICVHAIQHHRIAPRLIAIGATISVSLAAYVAITSHYSVMTANAPEHLGPNVVMMAKFAVVMTGASLLGKATFEQGAPSSVYYATGILLMVAVIVMWTHILRRPRGGAMFIFCLSVYSAANILAVAVFRYRNGLEGAMGQWYMVHTHFVSVAVVRWLFELFSTKPRAKLITVAFLSAILVGCGFGYDADWKKSAIIPEYKAKFIAEAPVILAFPETIRDKTDVLQTMFWHYPLVKKTIDLMYEHRLWIFRLYGPKVTGLTSDNWVESDRPVTLMCPSGTHAGSFQLWRKDGWPAASVVVRADGKIIEENANSNISVEFTSGHPAVLMIDTRDSEKSKPETAGSDTRKLVAIASNFQCH